MELPLVKQEILTRLLRSPGLRYRDAMPENVESDLFTYHLKHLIKQGLVEKNGDRYYLTTEGKRLVEIIHPLSPIGDISELFRVHALLVVTRAESGKPLILNQKRKRHPNYNDVGIVGGALKPGELVDDAYTRILERETGLTATFRTIGIIRKIRSINGGELFSDIFYFVGHTDSCDGELVAANEFGENCWVPFESAIINEFSSIQGGKSIAEVLSRLQIGTDFPFFHYEEKMIVDL